VPAYEALKAHDRTGARMLEILLSGESWPGESGQRGNWSFCLPAAKMAAEQERT